MNPATNPLLAAAVRQAMAAAAEGQFAAAEQHFRQALALAPDHPIVLIGLGHSLRRLQRLAEAKAEFETAIRVQPNSADAYHGLGLTCQDLADVEGAEEAYRAALVRNPQAHTVILSLATLCTLTGRPDEALDLLARVSTTDTRLAAAIEHQRGAAHLMKDRNADALTNFERALALQPAYSEAAHSRAIALSGLGRQEEALAGFRQAVKANPANLAAHYDLNQLLYRLGRDGEFLRSYDEAAVQFPGAPDFAIAKAALLVRSGRAAEGAELYEQALKAMPGHPIVLQGLAMARLNLNQVDAAIASYEEGLKRAPDDLNMLTGVAAAYLRARTPGKAEAAAQKALQLAPEDQTALALLGTAWRLMGDGREWDLNRYDDFIQVFDLEPPPGFGSMAEFCGELNAWLDTEHRDQREHVDQSLRRGTQTMGNLFRAGQNGPVEALRLRIEEAVRLYIERLPVDSRHAFLQRRGTDFRFAGSWSSRLKDSGFHVNHVHPAGWISSAFYVALPDTMQNNESQDGWIKFGEPSYDIGLHQPVRRIVRPAVGRLVLFPSYMWHGTVPFHAPQDRTTIAFDAVPARD